MTAPEQHDLSAHLRLSVAIDQLTQPGSQHLDRDEQATQQVLADLDTEHLEHIRTLRRRHTARPRRDHAGRTRLIGQMTAAGTAHRAQRARLAAGLATHAAVLPPLIEQLQDAVHGTGGSNGAGGAGANRSPIGLAAAELLGHIQRAVVHRGDQVLADQLRAWATAPWRHDQDADVAEQWVATARGILTPPRGFEAVAACPLCRTRHVWVQDGDERVQRAAIQIDYATRTARCIAAHCTGYWTREYFEHLARVLVQDNHERAR